jgi:peptidoglycan hydrolase-like protein with peptidoglycan-binding domain
MLSFLPPIAYRYTLKKPFGGSDVWALQMNLNLLGESLDEDGIFMNLTDAAVKHYQGKRSLTVDGIAGPVTQRRMCLDLLQKFASSKLPSGLLRGVIEGESGYSVGCVNSDVPGGLDCGWTQDRVLDEEFSTARFRKAFRAADSFPALADALDAAARSYYGKTGCRTARQAWWLATLSWNWPAAAQHYAEGTVDTWKYQAVYLPQLGISDGGTIAARLANGTQIRVYSMNTPAQWIKKIGVTGVSTGLQWADFYVSSKWTYIGNTFPTP